MRPLDEIKYVPPPSIGKPPLESASNTADLSSRFHHAEVGTFTNNIQIQAMN